MKRFVITLALMCALSSSGFAGDMPTGGIAPPANQSTETVITTSPGGVSSVGTAEVLLGDALSALLSVLSFLAT
jgi:hypothetical protein